MILSTVIWVVAGLVIIGLILYVVGVYNSVVSLDRSVAQVFGNLESVMKQRHDEIPKLVDTCRAYMTHERELLEKITEMRSGFEKAGNQEEKVRVENELNRLMGKFNLVWENYPELKANEQFMQIHGRITNIETIINDRREQFNEAVTRHNVTIARFPALMIAGLFTWREKTLLEISDEDKKDNLALFSVKEG